MLVESTRAAIPFPLKLRGNPLKLCPGRIQDRTSTSNAVLAASMFFQPQTKSLVPVLCFAYIHFHFQIGLLQHPLTEIMATLADELLNDFEDSGSEHEEQEDQILEELRASLIGTANSHVKNEEDMELDKEADEEAAATTNGKLLENIEDVDDMGDHLQW